MNTTKKIVLGIDPGFGIAGFGVISVQGATSTMVEYGCIKTSPQKSFATRLNILFDETTKLISRISPQIIAIEKLYFENNAKTAIDVGQARGVIMLAAVQSHIPIVECTPLQVKLAATGYGKAEKRQVQQMIKTLLHLKETPKPDDAADALAIAFCGSQMFSYQK